MVYTNEFKNILNQSSWNFFYFHLHVDFKKDNPMIYRHSNDDGHAILIYKFAYMFDSCQDLYIHTNKILPST